MLFNFYVDLLAYFGHVKAAKFWYKIQYGGDKQEGVLHHGIDGHNVAGHYVGSDVSESILIKIRQNLSFQC